MIIFFIAVSQKSPLLFQRCVNEIGPCWYGQCKLATLHRLFESLCLQRFPFPPPPLALSLSSSAISLSLSLLCAQYRRDYFIVCVQWKQDLYGHVYNHSLVRKQGYRLSNWLSKVLESLSYQYPSFFCYVWGACCMNAIFFVSLVKLNNISQCSCHIWPILFGIMSKNDG